MNYTITDNGIVFSFPSEEGHEEKLTDDLADAQAAIPDDKALETVKAISADIEAMG